jgi:hypothetical protein
MGLLSVLLLALMMSSLPAGATPPDFEDLERMSESAQASGAGAGLDDLISVDTATGRIAPLGIGVPAGGTDPIIGMTGVQSSTRPYFDVVWGGFLGGAYGTDILLYDRYDGYFEFRTVGSDGNTYEFWSAFGTSGWSHVVPGDYDGNGITDLLFYRASDGLMRFYTFEADGTFRAMTPAMFGTRGWTQMVPGDFDNNGTDDLMWYRARDGLMRFYTVDAPRFIPMTGAAYGTRNWGQIPSGDFDGDGRDDLMYYRPSDGLYRFYTLTGAGRFTPISSANYTEPYWSQILSGQFDQYLGDDLVFYMPGTITARGFYPDYLYSITDNAYAPPDEILTVLDWNPFN